MENASKALLIAGAVLIVILLIGVGMMIYNGAMGNINSSISTMNAQEIQTFNAQFEQYVGDDVVGSRVLSLISAIEASNAANSDDTSKQITCDKKRSDINRTHRYTVDVKDCNEGETSDGLISIVTITDNS